MGCTYNRLDVLEFGDDLEVEGVGLTSLRTAVHVVAKGQDDLQQRVDLTAET